MNWYSGNIAEAVAKSKTQNAIFVVYVEGKDENSAKLSKFIDDPKIKDKLQSDDFVAIKIESQSETYMQFAAIYQIVPVPSIFFIGKTGTPLDITTGVVASVEELESKIFKVLELAGKSPKTSSGAAMSQAFINQEAKASTSVQPTVAATSSGEQKSEGKTHEPKEIDTKSVDNSTEVVCEGGVCYKKPKEAIASGPTEATVEKKSAEDTAKLSEKEKEEKLAEARKILEQKRRERIEEEKRLEKERELERRKQGKDMQNLRAWQRDQELKDLKDSIKRDRLEEQAARERILAQIAADKAERAHKFGNDSNNQASTSQASAAATNSTAQQNSKAPQPAASDETRLQFRFASGDSKTKNFKCSTTLSEIRDYVKNELLPGTGIKEFTLATTYPKREFTPEHYSKTMIDLELIPSAVILIIGKEATGPSAMIAKQGGIFNIFYMIVMSILNPVFSLFNAAKNWMTGSNNNNNAQGTGAQKRANEERGVQDDIAKRRNLDRFVGGGNSVSDSGNNRNTSSGGPSDSPPSSSSQAYRRYVSGSNVHRLADNRKDSDDENATWNGNSTQQQ
ncbi:UBX domain-containing protein 4 [Musca vetustissima]|uniref:UBX domain-containing protein 4 n=1 Tax=Musca vetustissima TaxID=27455 RepID=UPI002AB6FCEC|nr:UBX domain-containing protein 4 [Musca vetustissima]